MLIRCIKPTIAERGGHPLKNKVKAVSSKLIKTRVTLQERKLLLHVPATHPFSRTRLSAMLTKYGMVYVKPDTGSLGIGVMRVERIDGGYRYQAGMKKHTFPTFDRMYEALRKSCGGRRHLIQKGIHVLRHEGRPFDFRVMMQKRPSGRWVCSGIAARVAHPQKAVTNGSQGGTIYAPEDLIAPRFGPKAAEALLASMARIGRLTAAQFGRSYPAMNELGLDLAVDRRLKPWILEVNTRPDPCPFTKLADPTSIRNIVAYAKDYGRKYDLTCAKARRAPRAGQQAASTPSAIES
ncbi:YheC/YheD family protein [Paenibacillus whitsoniae]|uniref:YheC/YheD family protein n=1 Tax=Paenibacillus whitsoniae TaxID=2496558 RepID=UPI001F49A900|nr:YheC/YheD family protein [Paenibacillus whitsoniae]